MKEISAIISSYQALHQESLQCVLATVVHVEGSSYRRAGARMLIDEYGRMTGAISGGCLEGDALQKALLALHERRNKLVTYDTSDESDAVIGAQLGCNGIIQVLFEPISDQHNPIQLLKEAIESKTASILCTHVQIEGNQHIGTISLEQVSKQSFSSSLTEEIVKEYTSVKHQKHSSFVQFEESEIKHNIFFQHLPLAPQLVIIGAGHDAIELANMAELLGWDIVITDGRTSHAKQDRFTSCTVIVSRPEHVLEEIELTDQTAFVLLSHNYQYDISVLKELIQKIPPSYYIGILGPKKKYLKMQEELKREGLQSEYSLHESNIFAPIGLNLRAETPAEIALSILAEIKAFFEQSAPEHLKFKNGSIHKHANQQFRIHKL